MCKSKINSKICGHVQLKEIVNQDLLYRRYFYRSNTSKIMRNDLKNVVYEVNNIEMMCKKNPQISQIIAFKFFNELCKKANSYS